MAEKDCALHSLCLAYHDSPVDPRSGLANHRGETDCGEAHPPCAICVEGLALYQAFNFDNRKLTEDSYRKRWENYRTVVGLPSNKTCPHGFH
jgi:hypothetical protein